MAVIMVRLPDDLLDQFNAQHRKWERNEIIVHLISSYIEDIGSDRYEYITKMLE